MKKIILLILLLPLMAITTQAQNSKEDLSSAAANPLADLMSFPFQNNLNINNGEYDRNVNILNIQPVIPFADGKFVTRTIFPIVRVPDFTNESGKLTSGLSDIVFSAFYVPESSGLMWGFGPVLELPTGGSKRGTQKWSIGPSFVALQQTKVLTLGILVNNAWSFAGKSEAADVNHMLINLFVVKQMGNGWYINSAPIITADWTAADDNKWIVPIGAGGGKLVMVGGKLPLNVQTQLYYNVVRPDFGPEWQWRVQAQILLPKSIFSKNKSN